VKGLGKAGARPVGLEPKVFRVIGAPAEDGRPPLEGEAEALRAALDEQVRALLAHDPGTRLGADPEDLHDLRVAARRLRAFLTVAAPALDDAWCDDLRARLRWLGGELGPARDLDVLVEHIRAESADLEDADAKAARRLLAELERRRAEARSAMVAALRSDPYLALLDDLEDAARNPRIAGPVRLERWAEAAFRQLRKRAGAIDGTSSDDALHDVRKTGKRARYAAELAEPVAGKPARRFVREAKRFQTIVGDHQDAAVTEAELRDLAVRRSGAAALVLGELIERSRERRRSARDAFPQAWRRLEKAGKAAWS
jgi:CHAD domain-containing protein